MARDGQRSAPELGSVSTEGTGVTSSASKHGATEVGRSHYNTALRTGDLAEERRIGHSEALAAEEKVSTNSSVAVLAPVDKARFLDPNADDPWVNPGDINRVPINVGQYLDADSESPSSSTSGASDVRQTPIDSGKHLSPDTRSGELVITIDGDSGNTQSNIGHYLDPEAESPEASGVDQSDQSDVGPFLEADI
jgi:hypothetical protein